MAIMFSDPHWFVSLKMYQDGKRINDAARRLWFKEINAKFPGWNDYRHRTEAAAKSSLLVIKATFPGYPLEVCEGCDASF